MTKLLLDTSILIDHLRQYTPATEFLETVFNSKVSTFISTITVMELYAGKSMQDPATEKEVIKFLDLFKIIPVTSQIAMKAGEMLRQYRHQGLTPSDAIIAGTALSQDANLVTRNIKHFRIIKGLIVFDLPHDK